MFCYFPTAMMFRKLPALLLLFSFAMGLAGCQNGSGTSSSNPFAVYQTIPPPATFSSLESFYGQAPGGFVPQPPASTFPGSGAASPTQPSSPPPATILSDTTNNNVGEGATLFAAATRETAADTGWAPIEVTTTNQTAFQAMEAKVNTGTSIAGFQADHPESLIVGTSHVVTTIVDDTATLPEPQVLLYTGGYGQ